MKEKGKEWSGDVRGPPPEGCPHHRGRRRGSAAADPRSAAADPRLVHVELHVL